VQQAQPQVPATGSPETLALPTPGRETLQKQRHVVQLDARSGVRGVGGDLIHPRHPVSTVAALARSGVSGVRGVGGGLIHHPVSSGAALARTGEEEYVRERDFQCTWQVLPAGGCVTTLTDSIEALLTLY